jgi:serine/threonine protein kinase
MAIQSGTHLGPYEILSAIGAGEMGEVYRARDTRLDRIVAIKILPDHLARSIRAPRTIRARGTQPHCQPEPSAHLHALRHRALEGDEKDENPTGNVRVRLFVRLDFSDPEKLLHQRNHALAGRKGQCQNPFTSGTFAKRICLRSYRLRI